METPLFTTVAEQLLFLFAPGLDGARSALKICCAAQTILRDRVSELEQERKTKQIAAIPPDESQLGKCGSDLLLLVCSFLDIKEKYLFRNSSLGLHSSLLGCEIDLTKSKKIRKFATIEFVLERFVPFQLYSNRGNEACGCVVARTIFGLKVGACLKLATQNGGAELPKAQNLQSIGFGRSWSVVGLSLLQKSDSKMLTTLLSAIQPNQIKKIAIGSRSAGILTAIGQALERGGLTGLQEIDFYDEYLDDVEGDEVEPSDLGTLSSFGPLLHRLNLSASQIIDITGFERCNHLRTLDLSFTHVADVSALGSFISLRTLNLSFTQVADVSALGSCNSLHTLDLNSTQVVDVSALGSCSSLHKLHLFNTKVVDVSALGSCSSLHTLTLSDTQVADVSALGSCSSLHTLTLSDTQVVDVSALGSCSSLHMLHLFNTKVVDVSALGSCSSLRTLHLFKTKVVDVSALGSCSSLHTLSLNDTQVADVSALGSCSSLHTLHLNDTLVVDVTALGSCSNLRTLDLTDNTQVTGVSSLGL